MKAEKNSASHSAGKKKHGQGAARSQPTHRTISGVDNAVSDNHGRPNDFSGSSASMQKLQSGKNAQNAPGTTTDSVNISQVSGESKNTMSECSYFHLTVSYTHLTLPTIYSV